MSPKYSHCLSSRIVSVDTVMELDVYFMSIVASFTLAKKQVSRGEKVLCTTADLSLQIDFPLLTLTMSLYTFH